MSRDRETDDPAATKTKYKMDKKRAKTHTHKHIFNVLQPKVKSGIQSIMLPVLRE